MINWRPLFDSVPKEYHAKIRHHVNKILKKELKARENNDGVFVYKDIEAEMVKLQLYTANYFKVDLSRMLSANRKQELVIARQCLMYVLHKFAGYTQARVGDIFNRNHATVIHAVKTVNGLMEVDKDFRAQTEKYFHICKSIIDNDTNNNSNSSEDSGTATDAGTPTDVFKHRLVG